MSASAASALLVSSRALSARIIITPPTGVDVAVSAARWIRRSRIETKNGVAWPSDPAKPDSVGLDLFDGSAGIVLFHLELFDATRDAKWLDEAKLGANELIARMSALRDAEACGLYDGLAGVAFVLEETHRATGDGRYRDGAKQAIAMIHGLAHKTITGAEWSGRSEGPDIVSGSAGIGLLLLWVDAVMDDAESRTLALATGRRLLEVGIQDRGGNKWVSPKDRGVSFPNFARGTAGVSYFLAELFRTAGDRACLAAALSGAQYLERIANTNADGFAVPHQEPGGETVYDLGWCHGPAGTARLFHELGLVTGRAKWRDMSHACARSIIASGAPEKTSSGYARGVDQCDGNAGIGELFIALQREKPNPAYAEMLSRLSASTLARGTTEGDAMKWTQSADPRSEQSASARTGYMRGAAGIGTYFLHADALANGRVPSITWPDSPWSRPCVARREEASHDMSFLNTHKSPSC